MSDDTSEYAEQEATLSAAFYRKAIADGIDELTARDMVVAFILGRQRREKREPWDIGESS